MQYFINFCLSIMGFILLVSFFVVVCFIFPYTIFNIMRDIIKEIKDKKN